MASNQAQVGGQNAKEGDPGPGIQKSPGPQVVAKIKKKQMNPAGLRTRKMAPACDPSAWGRYLLADEPRVRMLGCKFLGQKRGTNFKGRGTPGPNLTDDSWARAEKADEPRAQNQEGDSSATSGANI